MNQGFASVRNEMPGKGGYGQNETGREGHTRVECKGQSYFGLTLANTQNSSDVGLLETELGLGHLLDLNSTMGFEEVGAEGSRASSVVTEHKVAVGNTGFRENQREGEQ